MAKARYDDAWAMCPYYKGQTEKEVVCKGITTYQMLAIRFPVEDSKGGWLKNFCNNIKGYEMCPIYRMLKGLQV